jgi:hypothetical protein
MRKQTKINLIFDKKFKKYPKLKAKMISAADKVEEEVNSEEFREFILNHKFQNVLGFADCGDDNTRVLKRLLSGIEILTPELDHEWDIIVIPYYKRFSKAIGYTYPSKKEIWVNLKYYNQVGWTEGDCAGNMSHEWTHKAGFGHSFKRSWMWPFTVPYAVGNYIKKQINKKMGRLHLEEVESGGLNHMSWMRRAWYKVINFIF